MHGRKALAIFSLLFVPLLLYGQASSSHVSVQPYLNVDKVQPGSTVNVALRLTIENGWHINSHTPTLDYLIPTVLSLEPKQGFILSNISYPEGEKKSLGFADEPLSLYEGTVTIFFSLRVADGIPQGIDTLRGVLEVQACNSSVCAAPSSLPVLIPLVIAQPNEVIRTQHDSLFALAGVSSSPAESSNADLGLGKQSFLLMLLSIFLIGLALNLTPCVYPMLSVTVSLFGAHQEKRLLVVFLKALVYVLGMATMYSVLGVSAALGGGLFGSWLQSPYVLAGIALLLFALALSSFGLYQLQLPYWLTSKLGGTMGTGFVGLYLSGLVVGVFAAPCVGPPVIALLTFVATKGEPFFGFAVFFTLALGLGFPYLILGTFSGLLSKIPRSGEWLVWVEHIFGVILLAAGLFYLTLAFAPQYSVAVIPFVLVAGGIYLGFFESRKTEKKLLRRIQWLFSVLAVGSGVWIGSSLFQERMTWEPFSETALAEAQQQQLPVLIDFYADWCIPCLEIEHKTWTDKRVIDATKSWKRLKVDLTHFDSPEAEALRQRFSIAGVPTIIFLAPDGSEIIQSRVVGFASPEEILLRIASATTTTQ